MMTRRSMATVSTAAALALYVGSAWAADLTGKWTGHITDPAGISHELSFDLQSSGDKVTGTVSGGPPTGEKQPIGKGKLQGDQLTLEVSARGPRGESLFISYRGKVDGKHIAGTLASLGMPDSNDNAVTWEVTSK
jgi:hypothetical protein